MYYLAVIFFKLIAFSLSLFPRAIFLRFGQLLGSGLRSFHFREGIMRENIARAFPDWSEEKRNTLCRNNYSHMGILFLEILRSFSRFDRFLDRYCELENEDLLRAALAQGKGAFVLTAHLGNWEVLTMFGTHNLRIPVTMVTKKLKPNWLHRLVETERGLLGVKMAVEPKTMPAILRGLKKQELVGFVMDQFAGAPVGARVPFFGVPVGSHIALSTLALRTEAPVVPAIAYRNEKGNYMIRFEEPIPLVQDNDAELAIIRNTANYVAHTERWIREFPEQWLWIHRRWKGDLSPLAPNSPGEMLK